MILGYIIMFVLGVWCGVLAMMAAYLIKEDRGDKDAQEKT